MRSAALPDPAPTPPADAAAAPRVALTALETLWFQVGGTLCNLACTHCFVSCSPTNHTHELMTLAEVVPYLDEGAALGVKEYYFTGGEPFLNPDMEAILALVTARYGPATVLTNGLLLDAARCQRLRRIADAGEYSLDLRVSLDGPDAASNDTLRGAGAFARATGGIRNLAAVGLNPVLTATEVLDENGTPRGKERFYALLAELGIDKPRLKLLPVLRIGAEAARAGGYAGWQRLTVADTPPWGWEHLQCSSCRMVTGQGVWVCPILVNEPSARLGPTLADALGSAPLAHQACWTCHVHGVSCRT
ncbi:MAG TPA: radical SAM protein [Thermoanaerobaculia bacterium]|jgi:sulfatase maturation enzyme AslB (radical SAM superfamily)|nr:radical SAM protein [Thermoanaerobaculia bacterium]